MEHNLLGQCLCRRAQPFWVLSNSLEIRLVADNQLHCLSLLRLAKMGQLMLIHGHGSCLGALADTPEPSICVSMSNNRLCTALSVLYVVMRLDEESDRNCDNVQVASNWYTALARA